jgi:hypothetical protein
MFSYLKPIVLVLLAAYCISAHATSLQEFQAKSDRDQAAFISSYVLKMRNEIAAQNPELAQAIWTYFTQKQEGKSLSEGVEAFLLQELNVDALVKEGKADPTRVQIESLIVYVVKQKFRPASTN